MKRWMRLATANGGKGGGLARVKPGARAVLVLLLVTFVIGVHQLQAGSAAQAGMPAQQWQAFKHE